MAKESKEEGRVVKDRERQFSGKPHKAGLTGQCSLKDEVPGGMKTPKAPGDSDKQLTGRADTPPREGMGRARAHLERETERGEHAAKVGGETCYGHSGSMKGHRG